MTAFENSTGINICRCHLCYSLRAISLGSGGTLPGIQHSHASLIHWLYTLACEDVDGAEVKLRFALDILRSDATSHHANTVRVRLAHIELCHQNPTSCLALIQNTEVFSLPASITFNIQLLHADQCLFIQELGQAMVHTILSLVLAKNISGDSRIAASLQLWVIST